MLIRFSASLGVLPGTGAEHLSAFVHAHQKA